MTVAGIVLAGGGSTRLGGGDKTLRLLAGRPMLEHVLARLTPQVGPIAISANGDPTRFASFGLPVLGDDAGTAHSGPLSGVLAGMSWARQARCGQVLSVAGDTPGIPVDLAARLTAAAPLDGIAVASSGGRAHPVAALWPTGLAEPLRRFLRDSPTFSVSAFLNQHAVAVVDFPISSDGVDPFFNINTPADLELAETILSRRTR